MLFFLYSKKLEETTLSMDERKEHRLLFKLQSNDFKENLSTKGDRLIESPYAALKM